jgi:hypothetical protein
MNHNQLTNQALADQFENNFALANHAIRVAQLIIASGREVSPRQLLDDMAKNPGKYNIARLEEEAEKAKERQHEAE